MVATDVDTRGDTGRARRPAVPAGSPAAPARGIRDPARVAVWALMAAYSVTFGWLAAARHESFSTGRFDLGNMVQAVWSVAHGGLFETTDVSGQQFSRLGAHVDPILAVFAPAWWIWPSPLLLLIAQAVIVSLGALPAFWLGRRWLHDDRLAVAGAAVYLLFPALQHAVLFDFHPVTLAAPLLMFCIWAAVERRWWCLGICGTLAALSQEQVGLMLVGLAVWMWFSGRERRRAAVVLAACAGAWVAVAFWIVIPANAIAGHSPFLTRYSELGDGPGSILGSLITRPWEALPMLATPGRLVYLATLLLPLLLLPLMAPLLLAAALPQLGINLLAGAGPSEPAGYVNPIQTIEYHYAVVLVPFLVAAMLLGLAGLMAGRPRRLARIGRAAAARPGVTALVLVGAVLIAGVRGGPLPIWSWLPGGWQGSPLHTFTRDERSAALAEAVALIPPDASVSATNDAGAHLSARRRIMLFPVIGGADWVVISDSPHTRAVAADRPTLRPPAFTHVQRWIRRQPTWEPVLERAGVSVYRRVSPVEGEGASAS